jgi:hypothetical protein
LTDLATDDYVSTMRERYAAAKAGWSTIREDFRADLKYCSGEPSDQWDPNVKTSRDDDGIPALTMDRLNPLVNQIVNQQRKDRPQPKVNAGDGGDPNTADVIEGKVRHIMYASHADVAFNCMATYTASGGFGFCRVTKEAVGKYRAKGGYSPADLIFEPRVKRVADPLMVLFDPEVQELDYSDARYCFVPKKYDRKEYKRDFKKEPIPFPFDEDKNADWGDESKVVVAEYWWVENIKHRLIQLVDGRIDIATEIGQFEESDIINERELIERILHCDIVDGEGAIEECIWEGQWIPIIPQIASEVISDGIRRYKSAVRYSRDPQSFINVTMSGTAERVSTANLAPFIGPKGSFKDKKWKDGKRHFYLEYEPVVAGSVAIPPPQRNAFEPAIQGTTSAAAQGIDALKGAIGYIDAITRPSQADISGVAVEKRDKQANLANMQYEDSLVQSMWHLGRVVVDLLLALSDTPREWDVRKEDGTQKKSLITMALPPDVSPHAPGYEGQPHVAIDDGDYSVTISVGPGFDTKTEEGTEFLMNLIQSVPALTPIYLPAIFKRLGYNDLEEIATAAMPPAIRQALAQERGEGSDPAMLAQQAQGLQQENAQLKQALQEVLLKLQTKQVETEGKLQVQNAKTQGDLEKMRMELIGDLLRVLGEQQHDSAKLLTGHHMDAIKHVTGMLHASELPVQSAALNPPQPQGGN